MNNLTILSVSTMQSIRRRTRAMRLIVLKVWLLSLLSAWAGVTLAASSPAAKEAVSATSPLLSDRHADGMGKPVDQSSYQAMFQKAITEDLSGRPQDARKIYDMLQKTELAPQVAVPSAINLAALARFDEAKSAFAHIALSADENESNYAQIWQLWLTARTHTGMTASLKKQLSVMAAGFNVAVPYQRAIVDLYAGKGDVESVFKAIDAMPNLSGIQKQNVITEATFFTGAYLRYVAQDNKSALQVFKRYQDQFCILSLERPLINGAIAELETASRK
ncbi:hypothetical protein [Serratia fonticola]